jgi:homoserine kinase
MSSFTIAVPCSTSNLGSGFDAVGIALGGPHLLLRATPGGSGLRIARISGEGADRLPRDATNRLVHAAHLAAERAGRQRADLRAELEVHSSIPLQRGLGSSAAAALAGALLADRLLGGAVSEQGALEVAVGLEGHPDNVVPSLRGGAQVAILDGEGSVLSCPIAIGAPLQAAVFIPEAELETKAARAVLPRSVSLGDAVHNLGRAALLVAALQSGRIELLGEAMDDRLHQPARSKLLPWLPSLIAAAREAGAAGAALSGAGTTVLALCAPGRAHDVASALRDAGRARNVPGRAEVMEVGVPGARIVDAP